MISATNVKYRGHTHTQCHRFLSIAESEVGVGNDFSLELMSQNLGTNRRRIYDIINVLEALEMIVKQSKNWYTWLGKENLLLTLAKMRVCRTGVGGGGGGGGRIDQNLMFVSPYYV